MKNLTLNFIKRSFVTLNGKDLNFEKFAKVTKKFERVGISTEESVLQRITDSVTKLEDKINSGEMVYGVTSINFFI